MFDLNDPKQVRITQSSDSCWDSILRRVIEDECLIENWNEDVFECDMSWMGDVGFEAGLVLEGDKEAMGEAIVFAFDTFALTPFVSLDGVDFAG